MMRQFTTLTLLFISITMSAGSIGKFLKKIDNFLKESEASGIDTNYVRVPEYDRQIYIGGYSYYQSHNMDFPIMVKEVDLPTIFDNYIPSNYNDKRYLKTEMHTTQSELELGIDWRGVTIELPISLANKYSRSFGLAKNGSVWGFRLRYKHLEDMQGYVENAFEDQMYGILGRLKFDDDGNPINPNHNPIETKKHDIQYGDMDLKTFYAECYYVFNHKKFSLAAGMYADMIQLRPAGSFFTMANYYYSRLTCNGLLNYEHDQFSTNKLSIGAGYAYNLPFYNGRLCFHFSVLPMISLINTAKHEAWNDNEYIPETEDEKKLLSLFRNYNEHFYDACDYSHNSKFTVNGFGRFAVNYSFDRFILTFLANYRQYLFSNTSGFKVGNYELDAQLNFCWRF